MSSRSTIELDVSGLRSGPCQVLGNALGTDSQILCEQNRALAASVTVVSFEYPGHGGSPDWSYRSCEELGRALLASLDERDGVANPGCPDEFTVAMTQFINCSRRP